MNQRSLPVLLILMLLLAACAPLSPQPIAASQPLSADENTDAPPTDTPAPTATLAPSATPTPMDDQVVVVTNEAPNIVLTAVNLQLDQNQIKLTEAANKIATLSAESRWLETQVVKAKTQAAATAIAESGSSTNNSGSTNSNTSSNYEIPGNVYTVVTTDTKTYIFVVKDTNKNGAPIMGLHEPRVYLEPGTEAWVYKAAVKADGGELYYESYDPDGQAPKYKIYFRGKQIQIKLPNGNPNPANYPGNVAKATITDKVSVNTPTGYDDKGKPIMGAYKPYIHYSVGDSVILYPRFVVATGGSHWYPIYDSDGKPSGYLPVTKVVFPTKWD